MAIDSDPIPTTDEGANVNIRCSNGNKFSVKTNLELTVLQFKTLLADNCDVPPEQQRLIYKGKVLKDDQTLNSYGLQSDHTVHMVRGFAPSTPASSTPTNVVNASNSHAVAQGASTGAPLFPGLGLGALGGSGAPGLFGAGFHDIDQMQNPNTMRDIMSSPVMQNLMNNPEIMRSMVMSNPQMRDIIDRNPELGHILNDPSILRQSLEAARNPDLMREMMRNTDRALSNIESSPEGFNALRRMYENVQEPLMNATTMAGSGAAADSGSNPFSSLLGNQGGNQTRDVTNSTPAGTETTSGTSVPNASPLPNPWNNNGTGVTRTNRIGGAPPPSVAGLGGLGLPDMGMPDPSLFSQLLQNPAMSQRMQSLLSNPQYMEQMTSQNPQLRAMLDMNPQFREMMQNPDFLRQLASPESMQQLMALTQQLSQLGRQNSTPPFDREGGAQTGQNMENQMNLNNLMNMFGGLGAGAGAGGTNVPNVPPEELYATQLSQLQEMGFFDTQENIRALRATLGNVNAAVERLLNSPGL